MEDLKAILLEARTLSGAARAAYLDRVCDGNPSLREEIDSLLGFESAVPSVLDDGGLLERLHERASTPGNDTPTLDLDVSAAFAAAASATGVPDTPHVPSEPIGPYRLVEMLGEGGMGVVYRAEQTAPIRRDVALKLIRRGLDTDRVVARFDSERQALARMDHPSIARVLDAGASADGRPYFVMELVQGAPITEYCDREKLTLRDRIKLAIAVCHAVQHAHQKGIIHRDLKPSNILVASQDGNHIPKVIDFGIAKAIEEPLTDYTLLTRAGQFIGTPDYMSPEQAGVLDIDVDTRTDVYALGVLLYELLSGRRPHQFERRTQDEVQAVLRDQQPDRPSTSLSARRRLARSSTTIDVDTLARIAESRRTTGERLRRQLLGDLDNIVLKAMQKEPARRYGSIEQLADDLQRYLDGKPVLARPDTWTYRTSKFVRRHAVGVGVAAAAAIMLVTFAVVMAVQSARIARERDRALAAEQRARTEAETAQQVSTFLTGLFRSSDPQNSRGATLTAREILDRGAKRVTADLGDKPAIQGRLLQTLGAVYKQLGMYDEAATLMTQAVHAREKADPELLEESLNELGDIERYRGHLVAAEPLLVRALELRRKKFGGAHTKLAQSLNNLALVYDEQGRLAEAEATHREALRIRRGLGPKDPGISNSLSNLGITLRKAGKYAEAATGLREALALRLEANGKDHPLVASTMSQLGQALAEVGNYTEAEKFLRESLAIRRKVLPAMHPQIADLVGVLAGVVQDQNRLDEAEKLYLDALKIHVAIAAAPGAGPSAAMDVTMTQNNLATLYEMRGDYARAERLYQESLQARREIRGDRHNSVATILNNMARMRLAQGQLAAAERLSRDALSMRLELPTLDAMHIASTRTVLGRILHARGAFAEADQQFREVLAFKDPQPPPDHPNVVLVQIARGRLLIDRGRAAEAEPMLRNALNARTRRFSASDWRVAEVQVALARALLAQGKTDAAAPLLASSTTSLQHASPGQQALKREAETALAQLPMRPAAAPGTADQAPLRASR